METFTPEDNKMDDNEHHKMVRAIALLPTDAPDDRKFTTDEVKKTVKSMNNKKKTTASNVPIVAPNVITSLSLTGNRDWALCIEYEVFI